MALQTDADKNSDTASILQDLIRIDSSHPAGNEKDVVNKILTYIEDYDVEKQVLEHGNNRASLVVTIKGAEKDSLCFMGHIDTVPVDDEGEWRYPPFGGHNDGERIHGRGAADMKGGVTSMILTMLYFLKNEITPKNTLQFCFTADEELHGIGASEIVESGALADTKRLVIPEPSQEKIGLCEKGALWLRIECEGVSAHGSRPELGVNAIDYLFHYVQDFKELFSSTKEHPLLGKSSISLNKIKGGAKANVIPNYATATLDIRTLPHEIHEVVISKGKALCEKWESKVPRLKFNLRVENNRPAVETDKEEETLVKPFRKLVKEELHTNEEKGLFFYTDASQIIPKLNIPFVIFGPGDDKEAHQKNEKISIEAIEKVAKIFIRLINEEH